MSTLRKILTVESLFTTYPFEPIRVLYDCWTSVIVITIHHRCPLEDEFNLKSANYSPPPPTWVLTIMAFTGRHTYTNPRVPHACAWPRGGASLDKSLLGTPRNHQHLNSFTCWLWLYDGFDKRVIHLTLGCELLKMTRNRQTRNAICYKFRVPPSQSFPLPENPSRHWQYGVLATIRRRQRQRQRERQNSNRFI